MNYSKLHVADVYEKTIEHLHLLKHKQKIFAVLIEVLKKFDGKQITKRTEVAVENALPKCQIHLTADRTSLYIWDIQISYNRKMYVYLGRNDERFNYKNWSDDYDQSNLFTEAINNLEEAIKDINARVSEYNDAIAKLEQAEEGMRHLVYR